MIYKNDKLLLSLNANLDHIPEHADRIGMNEILDKLYIRQQEGESVKLIRNNTASIRIHEMELDFTSNVAIFLIHYSDTTISDPVFSELKTGKLRVESKLQGEGIAVSAHLAISLEPITARADTYDAILEETPGVSKGNLNQFFSSEFHEVSDFRFRFEDKEYKSRPKLKLTGKPSKGLQEDLEKGQLTGVTLEKFNVIDFMDEESIMVPRKASVELRIKEFKNPNEKKSILQNAGDLISKLHRQAKREGYDNVVVHFKTEVKRSKTVNIETKIENAMDVAYTKSHAIKLEKGVEQCEPELNNEIIAEMKKKILAIRKARKAKESS